MSSEQAITPEAAAERLLKLIQGQDSFLGFVQAIYPDYELGAFQLDLIDKLDQLEKGVLRNSDGKKVRRILVNMPPRHGKSTFATTLFPVYYLARKATREIMSVSYNAELAKTFGRAVRDHAHEPVVPQMFPDFTLSEEARAVDAWKTTLGGVYYGVGMGGTTTGRGANLLIIDDPVKSRVEAESATARNTNWSYYISALLTRKQPERDGTPPIEIVILTRWHPDDLAGRIMETNEWKNGEWLHVAYPAIIKDTEEISRRMLPEDDDRFLTPEEYVATTPAKRFITIEHERALWPERFSLEDLKKTEALDKREFASLYMQTPYIAGGNLIKSTWWRYYKRDEMPERYHSIVIAMDTAFKAKSRNDYSILMAGGITNHGDIHLLDVLRQKVEFPELKRLTITNNVRWRGKGLRGIWIEDKASGQSLIQELRKESGLSVIPYKLPSGDKISRANAMTPMIQGGRVYLPEEAPWLEAFLDETQQFPGGKHDDQVDALVMLLDVLSRMVVSNVDMLNSPIDTALSVNSKMFSTVSDISLAGQSLGSLRGLKTWGEL